MFIWLHNEWSNFWGGNYHSFLCWKLPSEVTSSIFLCVPSYAISLGDFKIHAIDLSALQSLCSGLCTQSCHFLALLLSVNRRMVGHLCSSSPGCSCPVCTFSSINPPGDSLSLLWTLFHSDELSFFPTRGYCE